MSMKKLFLAAMTAVALGGLYRRPALVERERPRHLLKDVLAMIHCIDIDGAVERTRRDGIHDIAYV